MTLRRLGVATVTAVALSTISSAAAFAVSADRDCPGFRTQQEAQAFFEANKPGDPHRLDEDNDGIACENLPGGSQGSGTDRSQVGEVPSGGVETGGAGTRGPEALTLLLTGATMLASGSVVLRRRPRGTSTD